MNESDKNIATEYLKKYTKLWKLSPDGDSFFTYCSLLQPVIYKDTPAMIKIPMEAEERKSSLLMVWWDGNGAAKVLEYDDNALLLERISGDHISLVDMVKQNRDNEATCIICSVAKKLYTIKKEHPLGITTLETWFKDLWPAAVKYRGIIQECAVIARDILDNQNDTAVLHGDLHHQNVLYSNTSGWVVIDPKCLIGERAFDYANIFCNPDKETALAPGRFMERLQIVSKEADLDTKHLLRWIIAWCGLSAAWILNEPQEGETPDIDLGVAEIALRILNEKQ
ncbi:aminoglycoside phosphotransferase family protein [Flavobacterium cerinum]|uniref:Uncharacterized protein n=1 Tax=Flavobacterium cerinum TaxID=2502784 RepID=A0A444HAY1_9FLAO|nr:aminoglycoside phosphotransferase family protein [Flavobacterium cerinum]RWX00491.1 hypothetical protein EPI11_09455 [Flavobacterium cerinum]